jgi:hypothetical protein
LALIVPGPHIHIPTVPRGEGAVHVPKVVAFVLLHGANFTVPSTPVPKFLDVTVIMPVVAAVEMLATYLDASDAPAAISQPQVSAAAGNTAAV